MKSRVPWTRCANFLFCSFSFCLRWCCSHKKGNQETKGVDFVFQKLGAKPLQRKPRNESTEGFCAPLNFLVWWFFPLWQSLISAFTKPPKPSKADAKALFKLLLGKPRTPQNKKSSPSISYFGGFFPIWQSGGLERLCQGLIRA